MNGTIKGLVMLALWLSASACTGDSAEQQDKANMPIPGLAEQAAQSSASVQDTAPPPASITVTAESDPEAVVKGFYAALEERDCQQAQTFRPAYTAARCQSVSKTTLNSLRIESNDGDKAVAYLNFSYARDGKTQDFVGYLWLKKNAGRWEIQEDFAPVDQMGLEKFTATYLGGKQPTAEATLAATAQPATATAPVTASSDIIDDRGDHQQLLADLRKRFGQYAGKGIILVDISQQKLFQYGQDGELLGTYRVSTATKGAGSNSGSDQTPLGAHRVSDRFGDGAKLGTIFTGRQNTGKLAEIITDPVDVPEDLVTTRILWLDGLEPGKNKGSKVDSHSRYIYIHGTPEEGLIGKPASHGCIRMFNQDVINVFRQAPENTLVYIGE